MQAIQMKNEIILPEKSSVSDEATIKVRTLPLGSREQKKPHLIVKPSFQSNRDSSLKFPCV